MQAAGTNSKLNKIVSNGPSRQAHFKLRANCQLLKVVERFGHWFPLMMSWRNKTSMEMVMEMVNGDEEPIENHHRSFEWYCRWPPTTSPSPKIGAPREPPGPTSRHMLPPGEYDSRRYRQAVCYVGYHEPSDVAFCQITLALVNTSYILLVPDNFAVGNYVRGLCYVFVCVLVSAAQLTQLSIDFNGTVC